mmetsp:Transcript_8808/g.17761  ORF Transcript_8808/g.17761 Transcript_8808/m.17761 type:complete len:280 (-) Transcript_8808:163-1002(-)
MEEATPPQLARIIVPGSPLNAGETSLTPQMRATDVGIVPPWLSISSTLPRSPRSPRSSNSSWVEVERKNSDGSKTPREDEQKPPDQRHLKAQKVSNAADAATSVATQTGSASRDESKEEEAKEIDNEDGEDSEDDEDDGLQMLLQMRKSRMAAVAVHQTPSCATPPPATRPAEPLEPGWDSANSGRRRHSKLPSVVDSEAAAATPSAAPTPADAPGPVTPALAAAADDENEGDWGEFYAHAKDSPKLRIGKHCRNLRQTVERQYAIEARAAQRQANLTR